LKRQELLERWYENGRILESGDDRLKTQVRVLVVLV